LGEVEGVCVGVVLAVTRWFGCVPYCDEARVSFFGGYASS